jgi:hypothetical protein
MQVLLINQNATIERLVSLSTGKLLYTLDKVASCEEAEIKDYDFIIIDSDLYDADSFDTLKNSVLSATTIIMLSKGLERPRGFDIFIEKPFLPTELVDILSTARAVEDVNLNSDLAKTSAMDDPTSGLGSDVPSLDDIESAHFADSDTSDIELASLDDLEGNNDNNQVINLDSLDIGNDDLAGGTNEEVHDEIRLDDIGLGDGIDDISIENSIDEDKSDAEDSSTELSLDDIDFTDDNSSELKPKIDEEITIGDDDLSGELDLDSLSLAEEMDDNPLKDDEGSGLENLDIDLDDLKDELDEDEGVTKAVDESETGLNLDELDLGDLAADLGENDDEQKPEDLDIELDISDLGLEDEGTTDEVSIDTDEITSSSDSSEETLADFEGLDDDLLADLSTEGESTLDDELPQLDDLDIDSDLKMEIEDEDRPSPAVPSSIFGDDEVRKLKDLLDDSDEDALEDESDTEEMSVQNDEFASLTEESIADALGIDFDKDTHDDFSDIGLENLEEPHNKPNIPSASELDSRETKSLQLSGNDLLSLPIDRIKELLEVADITVNITLSKKN